MEDPTPWQGIPGFRALPEAEQQFITDAAGRLRLSSQNTRKLCEAAVDLSLWEEPSILELWDESGTERLTGKTKSSKILSRLFAQVDAIRNRITRYDDFTPPILGERKETSVEPMDPHARLLGTCPVAGEKTRCCNLETLDAVKQCGFGCSYCSIQSFYDEDRVYFHEDLHRKLEEIELDPGKLYHIGTGQSSDSLMWGNRNGLLGDLFSFASDNQNVILELKTKAARTDWLELDSIPKNVIATWSLNTPTIIKAEEHLTASLEARLKAARAAADAGLLVGFHFHPMVWYAGWEQEYAEVIDTVTSMFLPSEVCMVSLGTLTFIRPVIRKLRSSGRKTRVTEIPLNDAAGKSSYPKDIKEALFRHAYDRFSDEWKEEVFFYLCMEDPALWEPVFGRSYHDNGEFEAAMKQAYMTKIDRIKTCDTPAITV